MTVVKDLIAVTGVHDLDLSFSALIKRSRDASLSLAVRHRYCSMLHRVSLTYCISTSFFFS